MDRRQCLTLLGATALGAGCGTRRRIPRRAKIAIIATVYTPASHADVRVPKLLNGYFYNSRQHAPRLDLASMYVDQVPKDDLSRSISEKHKVPIFRTVAEALTLGSGKLAVDGVFLIGEHGEYPLNEKGQKLYPRYRLYKEIVDVFRSSGRAVPGLQRQALLHGLERGQMDGRSVARAWLCAPGWLLGPLYLAAAVTRDLSSARLCRTRCLSVQAERKATDSISLKASRPWWNAGAAARRESPRCSAWKGPRSGRGPIGILGPAAFSRSRPRCSGRNWVSSARTLPTRSSFSSSTPAACRLLCTGLDGYGRGFAATIAGQSKPVATEFLYQSGRPWSHSSGQVYFMEEMVLTGKAAYPAERTLLVTGALAALMDSSYQRGKRLTTPHLRVAIRRRKTRSSIPVPCRHWRAEQRSGRSTVTSNRKSLEILRRNQRYIPGGIVSMNRSVVPELVFVRAVGAYTRDADGQRYLDYHAAFAPFFLGHNHPRVTAAIDQVLHHGTSLPGTGTTVLEGRLAELLCEHIAGGRERRCSSTPGAKPRRRRCGWREP